MAEKDLEADRDPDALFRTPFCRFLAVRCPPDAGTVLRWVNESRREAGLEPLTEW